MSNMNNNTTQTATKSISSMTWMVDYSGEMVNESRTGKRSSDGRFLKMDVKLNTAVGTFSTDQQALAELYDTEPEFLFMARR